MSLLGNALKAHNTDRPPYRTSGFATNLMGGGGQANQTAQLNAMASTSWLFAGVSLIAESVAGVDWTLYRQMPNGEREAVDARPGNTAASMVADHFRRLWEMPNPFYTRAEFVETVQQHFELVGEMWWILVRNQFGVVVELWPIRPDRMTPVPGRDEFIVGYVYRIGSERIPLHVDDVIFQRRASPLDPYRGSGVVRTLIADIESEKAASLWQRNFFANDATPGGVLEFPEELSEIDFARVVDHWHNTHKGVANAGRIAVLENATFKERKFTQRDMQFEALRKYNRDLILGALRVPYALLGGSESINRANAEALNEQFARYVIQPKASRLRETLNTQLLMPEMGLEYDFTDPTPENREQNLREAVEGYDAGLLNRNEGRGLMGYGEAEVGGGEFKPLSPGPTPPITLGLDAAPARKALPERDAPIHAAEEAMLEGWRKRLAAEAAAIAEYVVEFMKWWSREGARTTRRVDGKLAFEKIEISDLEGYDWDWWTKYGEAVIDELADATLATMLSQFPDMEVPVAQRLATEYATARTSRILQATGDQSLSVLARRRVGELVAGTIERGDSLGTLQKALREDFAFSSSRAELIARTETATAQGQGAKNAAAHFELDQKRWFTQGDVVVTPECAGNAAVGWIAIVDPFPSGHDTIPVHPRCRCNVQYRQGDAEGRSTNRVGLLLTVNCPDCSRRLPVNNLQGRTDVFCRYCKKAFPFSSEGAPNVKRTRKLVERDDEGHIAVVEETVFQ